MTSTAKQRAVVICPGRGTYNKEELGYLQRHHQNKSQLLNVIDTERAAKGQPTVQELDQMQSYSMKVHTAGENASSLIYACAAGDFQDINQDKYDIVGVTGNSMGWYIALAVSGALSPQASIEVINTMGSMMAAGIIGGQLIYPVMNEHWHIDQNKVDMVNQSIAEINLLPNAQVCLSINLGGYLVLGGNNDGLVKLSEQLPTIDDTYPMRLFNHAAFHTPLLTDVAAKAQQLLPTTLFNAPSIPLIDGLGNIWQPYTTDIHKLHHYTLQTQVCSPYNYSKAIEVAIKEFAPDKLIILGPGATLGGATAQSLIAHQWQGLLSKQHFIEQQKTPSATILSMGIAEQRAHVI